MNLSTCLPKPCFYGGISTDKLSCSCRRKDAQVHDNDPSLSLLSAFPTSPSYEVDAESDFSTRTILPSKLPTPRPLLTRIPPVAHDGKSDLDPTEWKPSEGGPAKGKPGGKEKAATWRPKISHRPSSEAYSYLSQYHRSAPTSTPRLGTTHRSTPSLSHTPTTTASSDDGMVGTPAEICNGSLVPRGNSSSLNSDEDVVTPKIASIVSTTQLEAVKGDDMENTLVNGISYDKKWVLDNKTSATGRLKKLLGHGGIDDMTFTM